MAQIIKPCEQVQATLTLPGSKSYTHRALMAAALAGGESVLTNALAAEDTELTAAALKRLGAGIDWQGTTIRVTGRSGRWLPARLPIYLGNSGTSMRFLTALAALGEGEYLLTGTDRLCQRPLGELLEALGQAGVQAVSERGDGCPPVRVTGGLTGGKAQLSGAISSQYLSALLFIGPLAPAGLKIGITGELVSRPYVDLTLEVLGDFGISYYREGYRYFELPGGQCYLPREYEIEADASSASYFWAAAALTGGRVTITNLSLESSQGDAAFPEVLGRMGCGIESTPAGLTVQGGPLRGVTVDMATMPDLVPTLAVLAAFATGDTVITGVAHLRHKESDRLAAVAAELGKLGIEARETDDGLVIRGGAPQGAVIHTYSDHRIAMSFAVAGLKIPGVAIEDPECVAKSFPDFWQFFKQL
ncbi:MAG: 3-phosphoshikimate 1-carboxyvinyltransferase [Proteobacteria bacterium]|nr:3-phosphoshikimate 1-carboxyvinyltransferase [Pseudomonadota bacterium]MBU4447720.1 3-phosphoshikimate 1-carboxyvinyltransferase [Pseudomonadota bacterium]MCG2770739.1 3-phosphoshikimate 1-carboxyvinyltransferase [Desulfobacterales bacterium]